MIGIYKIAFTGTNKVYIGQSSNIEVRITTHKRELKTGVSAAKLQQAYMEYGEPIFEVLEETSLDLLDYKEKEYIVKYSATTNGFNTTPGGHSNYGAEHSTSKYSKETYLEILNLLVNSNKSAKEIAAITSTTDIVVKHISDLSRHSWLLEADPINYTKLVNLRNLGSKNCAAAKGIDYPIIVSPSGNKFKVLNTRKFSEEHSIPNGALCGVLNGRQQYANGWHLESTPPIPLPTKVVCPDGIIYEIPYRGIPLFCNTHNLSKSSMRLVLSEKQKAHKGWKLVQPSEK